MDYFVIGPDGSEYGPADFDTLKRWASENRVTPATQLREKDSGRIVRGSDISGLLGPAPGAVVEPVAAPAAPIQDWSRAPTYALTPQAKPSDNESSGPLWGVIARSALGVVLFFVLHGIGLLVGGYSLYYAIQLKSSGSKYGTIALVIAGVSFVAIAVGWVMRLSGAGD